MPEIRFDKNYITTALFKKRLNGWEHSLDELARGNMQNYMGPKTEEDAINYNHNGNEYDVYLMKTEMELYKNPRGEFAQQFKQYWDLMKYVFMASYNPAYDNNYKLILRQINTFDQNVQLDVLKRLFDRAPSQSDLKNEIAMLILNNKTATTDDKYSCINPRIVSQNRDIVRDFIEDFKRDLDKELKTDYPSLENITRICKQADNLVSTLRQTITSDDKQWIEYIDIVRNEFDLNKVLAMDTQYVQKYQSSLEERAASAESRLKTAEQRATEFNKQAANEQERMQTEMEELRRRYEQERQKNEQLTGQLDSLNAQVEKQNSFIKTIKIKIGTLKTGLLGNSGVKELQEYMQQNQPDR